MQLVSSRHGRSHELVSVVVPTYSRSAMLPRALASVDKQTYPDIEIVIVDDNGKGTAQQIETQKRLEGLAFRSGISVVYVIRQANGGGAVARNSGIAAASGSYIGFLDDDDEWLPEKVAKQIAVMKDHEEVGLTYAHCKALLDDGKYVLYRRTVNGNALFEQACCGCIAATSQWVARKDALLKVGCFSDSPSKQDSILLFKLLLAGYEIRCVPEVLSLYDQHSSSRISTSGKTLEGERNYSRLIRDNRNAFSPDQWRIVEGAIRYRLGRLEWLYGDKMKGTSHLMGSFIVSPAQFVQNLKQVRSMKAAAIDTEVY